MRVLPAAIQHCGLALALLVALSAFAEPVPVPVSAVAVDAVYLSMGSSSGLAVGMKGQLMATDGRSAELEVLAVQRWPALQATQLLVQARVLAVVRQPRGGRLRPGDRLQLRYPLPPQHASGWVGPAPLPLLTVGQRVPAWLAPDPAAPGAYRPAAGGRSFGPVMEAFRE